MQDSDSLTNPEVDPVDKVRPTAAYMLSQDDVKEFPKYETIWKQLQYLEGHI